LLSYEIAFACKGTKFHRNYQNFLQKKERMIRKMHFRLCVAMGDISNILEGTVLQFEPHAAQGVALIAIPNSCLYMYLDYRL
jgi:urease beta subunit